MIQHGIITEHDGFRELFRDQIKTYLKEGYLADADVINSYINRTEANNKEFIQEVFDILMKSKKTKLITGYPSIVTAQGEDLQSIQAQWIDKPKLKNQTERDFFKKFEDAIITPTATRQRRAGGSFYSLIFDPHWEDDVKRRNKISIDFLKYLIDKLAVNGKFIEGFAECHFRSFNENQTLEEKTRLLGNDKGDTLENHYFVCKLIREKILTLGKVKVRHIINLVNYEEWFKAAVNSSKGIQDPREGSIYPDRSGNAIEEIFNSEFYKDPNIKALYMELKLSNKK
jgi:hypothetical protein